MQCFFPTGRLAPLLGKIRGFGLFLTDTIGRTPVEKRIRSSQIVILTAVSSLLLACVITSPAIFIGVESRNGDPAAEASILAERHLDRAMDEMKRTGNCSAEGRVVSCDDGCGSVYHLDTRLVREPSGEVTRVSVRVKWKGPLGGGTVVATEICEEPSGYDRAAMNGSGSGDELLSSGSAVVREAR